MRHVCAKPKAKTPETTLKGNYLALSPSPSSMSWRSLKHDPTRSNQRAISGLGLCWTNKQANTWWIVRASKLYQVKPTSSIKEWQSRPPIFYPNWFRSCNLHSLILQGRLDLSGALVVRQTMKEWRKTIQRSSKSWRRSISLILSDCPLNMIETFRLFIVDMNHSATCARQRCLFNDLLLIKRFVRPARTSHAYRCLFMQYPHRETCLLQLVFDQILRGVKSSQDRQAYQTAS